MKERTHTWKRRFHPFYHLISLFFERFVFTDDTSNKFWETAIDGTKLIVRFGRIGTKGQTQTKSFATDDVIEREREKLRSEKMNKG